MSCGLHGNQKKHGRDQCHPCWLKRKTRRVKGSCLMKHLYPEGLIAYTGFFRDFCNTVTIINRTIFQQNCIFQHFQMLHMSSLTPIRAEGEGAPMLHIRQGEMVGWQKVLHWVSDRTTAWSSVSSTQCYILALDFPSIARHRGPKLSPGHQNFCKSPGKSATLLHVAKLLFPPSTSRSQATEKN